MSNGNFYDSFQGEKAFVTLNPNPSFREEYHAKVREFDTPIEIQDAIRHFSEKYTVCLVSSGSEDSIKHFLEKEGLLKHFTEILGHQTHKSKVIKINGLLEKYSVSQRDAVFITDTLGDIREGNEAGIRSVGVTWGLHDRETLQKGTPEIIIDDPRLLEETIERILIS